MLQLLIIRGDSIEFPHHIFFMENWKKTVQCVKVNLLWLSFITQIEFRKISYEVNKMQI